MMSIILFTLFVCAVVAYVVNECNKNKDDNDEHFDW